mmetsp:Transcript_64783/g.74445  ORF Transcript_64783/g.74445 Transcript_64783/m.74445 type:complete len:234 (+) Transcript_64783:1174-1875(+)
MIEFVTLNLANVFIFVLKLHPIEVKGHIPNFNGWFHCLNFFLFFFNNSLVGFFLDDSLCSFDFLASGDRIFHFFRNFFIIVDYRFFFSLNNSLFLTSSDFFCITRVGFPIFSNNGDVCCSILSLDFVRAFCAFDSDNIFVDIVRRCGLFVFRYFCCRRLYSFLYFRLRVGMFHSVPSPTGKSLILISGLLLFPRLLFLSSAVISRFATKISVHFAESLLLIVISLQSNTSFFV